MACYPLGLALNSKAMSNEKGILTWDQAGHLMTIFKQKKVTKERFEAMKPFLSDLCESHIEELDREDYRESLGLPPAKLNFFVDYNKDLPAMIAAAGVVVMTDGLVDSFPIWGTGKVRFEPKIFLPEFNNRDFVNSDEIEEMMKEEDYRPASITELLAYARVLPNKQRKFSIVALSSTQVGNRHDVASLQAEGKLRTLRKYWYGAAWSSDRNCRFLGIKIRK